MRSNTAQPKLSAVSTLFTSNHGLRLNQLDTSESDLVSAYIIFRYYIHLNVDPKHSRVNAENRALFKAEFIRLSLLFYSQKHKEFVTEIYNLKPIGKVHRDIRKDLKRQLRKAKTKAHVYTQSQPVKVEHEKHASQILRIYANCDAITFFTNFYNSLSAELLKQLEPEMPYILQEASFSRSLRIVKYIQQLQLDNKPENLEWSIACTLKDILDTPEISNDVQELRVRNYCYGLSARGVRLSPDYKQRMAESIDTSAASQAMKNLRRVFLATWDEIEKQEGAVSETMRSGPGVI